MLKTPRSFNLATSLISSPIRGLLFLHNQPHTFFTRFASTTTNQTPSTTNPTQSATNPTPSATNPTPSATNPTPSATNPTPPATNPTPSATNPTPPATNPTPSATKPTLSATDPVPSAVDPDEMPPDMIRELHSSHPRPMRFEFNQKDKVTSQMLENMDIGVKKHRIPATFSDFAAFNAVRLLRWLPDTYFKDNHYMRVVMLETVAAVPGMVGGMLRHLRSLRNVRHDGGWIIHLLHEAENERMHLLTWMKCLQPTWVDRSIILGVQGAFFNAYFLLYLLSPRTAHRFCGYLEEEAVISYTHFLKDIDEGKIENRPAPRIAKEYYNLQPTATIRDVVLAVRSDEALHRDSNHHFADRIAACQEDLRRDVGMLLQSPEWRNRLGNVSQEADQRWGRGEARGTPHPRDS